MAIADSWQSRGVMRLHTYPIFGEDGMMFAVEIERVFIRARTLAKVLSEVDGVTHMRIRGEFQALDDEHANFLYHGIECMIWEPFGDNSRFWIGPIEPEKGKVDVTPIQHRLSTYRPTAFVNVFGNLLMFRWRTAFKF